VRPLDSAHFASSTRTAEAHVIQLRERIVTRRAGTVTATWRRHGQVASVEPVVQRPRERGKQISKHDSPKIDRYGNAFRCSKANPGRVTSESGITLDFNWLAPAHSCAGP
jgi:hypothetical protein